MGTKLEQTSTKEDMEMANNHTKKCSIVLVVREMKIKTTVRCYFIFTLMLILKRLATENVRGDVHIGGFESIEY